MQRCLGAYVWLDFFYAFFIIPESASKQHYHIYQVFQVFRLNIIEIINHPFEFLWEGTVGAFWFFPSLILGLNIVVWLYLRGREKYILPLGVVLYLIALLGKDYSVLPWGYQVDFEMRRGPFVSVLFVGIGWFLAKKEKFRLKTAILLIAAGLGIQILETLFLYWRYGLKMHHEYLLGTILFCTGIFVFTLARPDVGKGTIFPEWGKLTLGVYVLHTFYIKIFGMFRPYFPTLEYEILQPAVIFLLSIFTTFLFRSNSLTRILVT